MGIIGIIVPLALVIALIAGFWKLFEKAGQPGWGCMVPFYSNILWAKIAGRPPIWGILSIFFFPLAFVFMIDTAKNFGKGIGFGIGLIFLPFIFGPILGFGDAQYNPVTPADSQR